MLSIKRILVSTDFSEAAERAYSFAVSLAQQYNAELHVVHVVEDSLYYAQFVYEGAPFDPAKLLEGLTEDRKKRLDAVVAGFPQGLKVRTHLRRGVVVSEIVGLIKELDVDLMVISTHGRTGLAHLFIGSVAERVIRECPCPVLTVRAKGNAPVAAAAGKAKTKAKS